jgi:hypothetical protein
MHISASLETLYAAVVLLNDVDIIGGGSEFKVRLKKRNGLSVWVPFSALRFELSNLTSLLRSTSVD